MNTLALRNKNEADIDILLEIYDLACLNDSVTVMAMTISMMDIFKCSKEHTAESFIYSNNGFTENLLCAEFLRFSSQPSREKERWCSGQSVMRLKFSLNLSEHETLGKFSHCSRPQFPHWQNEANNTKLMMGKEEPL